MAGFNIVDFSPQLSHAFDALNREWLEEYFHVEPIDELILTDPATTIIAPGGAILFAVEDKDVVGTVALKRQGETTYELTKMAVTADRQGAGIGRALLCAAVEKFHELRGERLYLESHSSLAPALHLYESAGFVHEPSPEPSDYARADVYMVYAGGCK